MFFQFDTDKIDSARANPNKNKERLTWQGTVTGICDCGREGSCCITLTLLTLTNGTATYRCCLCRLVVARGLLSPLCVLVAVAFLQLWGRISSLPVFYNIGSSE